jgi:hypothetical protein
MAMVLRRLAGASGSPSASAAALLLRPALTRPISTGFREERDTFGPVRVPNDKYVLVLLVPRHSSAGFRSTCQPPCFGF